MDTMKDWAWFIGACLPFALMALAGIWHRTGAKTEA